MSSAANLLGAAMYDNMPGPAEDLRLVRVAGTFYQRALTRGHCACAECADDGTERYHGPNGSPRWEHGSACGRAASIGKGVPNPGPSGASTGCRLQAATSPQGRMNQ